MKLGPRLILGFAGVIGLIGALAAVSIIKVDGINTDLKTINTVNSVKQRYAINFRGSVHDRAILMRDILLLEDKGEIQATLDGIAQRVASYAASAEKLDAMMADNVGVTPDEREASEFSCCCSAAVA
jgi:methyl-accepting chemotaxis protein